MTDKANKYPANLNHGVNADMINVANSIFGIYTKYY